MPDELDRNDPVAVLKAYDFVVRVWKSCSDDLEAAYEKCEKLRAGRARIAAQARAEAIEECAAAIRKHRSEYEAALANPRDKEWDDGYRSGTSNALFIVEELANPDDVVREELIADTESVYSAERDSRT